MKNYLYSILAAGMLLGTSCSENELVDVTRGEGQKVTYTVALPGAESRAIEGNVKVGDGYYADRLIYAMYENGSDEVLVTNFADRNDDGKFTVEVTMAKDIKYDLLFMAYNPDNCAFVINNESAKENNLRAMTIKPTDLKANQEQYDAFVGQKINQGITAEGTTQVDLYRPFAQVNAATTEDELAAVKTLMSEVTSSKFVIYGAPNTLDIYDNSVSGTATHTYAQSKILACSDAGEEDYPNEDITVGGTNYKYLAMAYVLAGKTSENYNADFEFYRADNKVVSSISVINMPIQANHRTNVLGNLLTQKENYTISVDADFEGDHDADPVAKTKVTTGEDIQKAINDTPNDTPTVLEAQNDITLGAESKSLSRAGESPAITIPAGKIITINLNGFTISQEYECTDSYSMIENKGKLTIVDRSSEGKGKISFKDLSNGGGDAWGSYVITNKGELIVEEGTLEHCGSNDGDHDTNLPIQNYQGKVTINGGTISSKDFRSLRDFTAGGEIIINGGTFEGQVWMQGLGNGSSSLTINGGNFTPVAGYDVSSVFITNNKNNIIVSITGGTFNTKIGCSNVEQLAGAITGGTFTETAKANTDEALLAEKYGFVENEDGTYDVVKGDYLSLGEFVDAVIAANGDYDGQGELVKIMVKGGQTDGTNACLIPDRLQKYGNPDVYYAQYQRFAELTDVNISNVNFEFVPAAVTVTGAWNTSGATTTADNINGELQFMNSGKVTLTDCTFNMVSVSPINATELEVTGCSFNGLDAYTIKDIKADSVAINNDTFADCNGGFWFADAPESITANNNTFTQVGRRGAIQFSVTGDYTNSSIEMEGNTADGAFLWQLNSTVTDEQLEAITNNNTYQTLYVAGSIQPVAQIGSTKYKTLQAAAEAAVTGETITLLGNVTLTEKLTLPAGITFNGNNYQIDGTIYAGGDLTFEGYTKVTAFSATYYDRTITIGECACLEVTGTGRVTLGYGNTFNITGSIETAKTADKANVQPSLIIPAGISITGGNDATFNVTNAYVKIGNTSSKNNVANGKFTLNFNNSIAEFTNQFTLSEPTEGKNPTFEMNITNSVFTTATKLCVAAPDSKVVVDGSEVTLGTYIRNSGKIELKNNSELTGSTIQFGENGGNDGKITVDASKLTVTASSTGHAFDGKGTGSITLTNNATADVTYYKDMTITWDTTSNIKGTDVTPSTEQE